MSVVAHLVRRNVRLYFKDRGMFISSLITPIILLVLYAFFLFDVYKQNLLMALPGEFLRDEGLADAFVSGLLISSLLAVSCVTVSFCANLCMIKDKVTGARRDLTIAPIRGWHLAAGYYIASAFAALIVCLVAGVLGLSYIAGFGWYFTIMDLVCILADVVLLVLFGVALSSLICYFLSTEGQMSAVGTIISAGYGFLCGAYTPISMFPEVLQKVLSFLPGTYGTALIRNHTLRGVLAELNLPREALAGLRDAFDCNLYFFDAPVSLGMMYLVLVGAVVLLVGAYVLINYRAGMKTGR